MKSRTAEVLEKLKQFESRNVTFIDRDGQWPIVWERARGVHVWDADGRKYLDLTAAFGVAATGHANPRVVRAGRHQLETLPHAMGDVHPHRLKADLTEKLSGLTFERWNQLGRSAKARSPATARQGKAKTIFCNSGFEAVEAALKTAFLATKRPGIVAFEGAYHGTGYGSLVTTHRAHFRASFQSQLGTFGHFVTYPAALSDLERTLEQVERLIAKGNVGAILIEPIQVRGGIRIPPAQLLPALRRLCGNHGVLLILDEIYTGFGRTGRWFACEHTETCPDLICLGKALTGGFPLSACVGPARLMDQAWPGSKGEAIHTSTFLGNPVGCAMALAQLRELETRGLVEKSAATGVWLLNKLEGIAAGKPGKLAARGSGLLIGLELQKKRGKPATRETFAVVKEMLRRGFILLPEGDSGNVIGFTPPLTISRKDLEPMISVLRRVIYEL